MILHAHLRSVITFYQHRFDNTHKHRHGTRNERYYMEYNTNKHDNIELKLSQEKIQIIFNLNNNNFAIFTQTCNVVLAARCLTADQDNNLFFSMQTRPNPKIRSYYIIMIITLYVALTACAPSDWRVCIAVSICLHTTQVHISKKTCFSTCLFYFLHVLMAAISGSYYGYYNHSAHTCFYSMFLVVAQHLRMLQCCSTLRLVLLPARQSAAPGETGIQFCYGQSILVY